MLYLAEHKARQAVETRAKIREKVLHRDKEAKEDELRKLALHARMERVNTISVHEHSSAGFDEQHLGNERGLVHSSSISWLSKLHLWSLTEYLRRSDSPADKIDHDTVTESFSFRLHEWNRTIDTPLQEKQLRDSLREDRKRERERDNRLEVNYRAIRLKKRLLLI